MWYYATDSQKQGPVSEEEVIDLVRNGDLEETDLVWTASMDEWKQVSEVDKIHPDPPPLPNEDTPPDLPDEKPKNQASGEDSPTTQVSSEKEADEAAPASKTHSSEEPNVKYASFGKRLTAYALDNLILFAAVFLISLSALLLGSSGAADIEKLARAFGLFGGIGYFILFEASYKQATFGKQIMGLRVVDTGGEKIGLGKATLRTLGKGLSGAIFLIGFIMAGFTDKNQALHDKLSGCLVLEDTTDS